MAPDTLLFVQWALAAWLVAGGCDWWCHRHTRIEATSGIAECLFHWLLLAQGGAALMLALWLQPSLLLMAMLFVFWLAHQATTWLELRYVVQRRNVMPTEQMVHSFLEMIPLGLIAVMALDVASSAAPSAPHWPLQTRPWESIAPLALTAYAAATLVLVIGPFAEETWRCLRYRARA